MRFVRAALLLAPLPFLALSQFGGVVRARTGDTILAQQGDVVRESTPPDTPSADTPSDDTPASREPVTAAPLPPAEVTPAPVEMVPNPLDDPSESGPRATEGQGHQPQGQVQRGGWVQMGTASLQALDKVNARSRTLTVKVGQSARFGTLDVAVRGCYVRTPDRPADATALLVIRDEHADTVAFSGWMVRSDPALSMMSNPVYDVRVNGCAP